MRSFPHIVVFVIFVCCAQHSFGQRYEAHGRAASMTVSHYHARPLASPGHSATFQGAPNQLPMSQGAYCSPSGCDCEGTAATHRPQQYVRPQRYTPTAMTHSYPSTMQQHASCPQDECCSEFGDASYYVECPPQRCCVGNCFHRLWELEKRKNEWIFGHLGLR